MVASKTDEERLASRQKNCVDERRIQVGSWVEMTLDWGGCPECVDVPRGTQGVVLWVDDKNLEVSWLYRLICIVPREHVRKLQAATHVLGPISSRKRTREEIINAIKAVDNYLSGEASCTIPPEIMLAKVAAMIHEVRIQIHEGDSAKISNTMKRVNNIRARRPMNEGIKDKK